MNKKACNEIKKNLRPVVVYSFCYLATVASYFVAPFFGLFSNQLLLPYKLILRYDVSDLWGYCLLAVLTWGSVVTISFIVAESNLLATMVLHLNGRYLFLKTDLKHISQSLLDKSHPSEIAMEFQKELTKIIGRNMELNEFASKLEEAFTFRLFIIMANSAILLCVLGFKVVTVSLI